MPHAILLLRMAVIVAVIVASVLGLESCSNSVGMHLDGSEAAPYLRDAPQRFHPNTEWKLTSENERPIGGMCMGYCRAIDQVWDMGAKKPTCQSLQQFLTDSGFVVETTVSGPMPGHEDDAKNCATGGMLSAHGRSSDGYYGVSATINPWEGSTLATPGTPTVGYKLLLSITK